MAAGLGYEILGAVKVKDGLFIGDELAAQDLEFVVSNKVTRIINCCGRQVPNHWESIGVVYLTYYWVDADNQVILDQRDVVAGEIFRFIEAALSGAESVLIHSVRGQSRSCCVLSAYMMKKHSWGLRKTMEFLSFRRPDMNLKPAFLQQLSGFERRLMSASERPFSLDWNDADFNRLESEELLLRNTYLNSQMGPLAEFHPSDAHLPAQPRRLMWCDGERDDKAKLEKPAGADRIPVVCDGDGSMLPGRSVLKKSTAAGGGGGSHRGAGGLHFAADRIADAGAHWPMPAENPEVQHPPPAKGPGPPGVPPGVVAGAAGGVGGGYGGGAALSTNAAAAAALAAATAAAASMPVAALGGGAVGTVPGAPEVVSNAWMNEVDPAMRLPLKEEDRRGGLADSAFARGPATSIRDSLRRESTPEARIGPNGGSRPPSRDPSPKTTPGRRGESPGQRGNSRQPQNPIRYGSPASQRGSVGSVGSYGSYAPYGAGAYPAAAPGVRMSTSSTPGGYPGGPGLSVGSARPGGSASAPGGMGPGGQGSRGSGMGAFRSGGPVRAKADLLGEGAPMRRPRPATAPTTRTSNSRPASPIGAAQRSGSSSRPASPHTAARAGSPAPPVPQPQAQAPPLNRSTQGMSYPHAQTHRSLSGHMRRAPSPTPAFNRNPSPGKPRWRG